MLMTIGPAVDPDPDGDLPLPGTADDSFYPVLSSDITRVDPDLVRPVLHSQNSHFIVKMNISDKGDVNAFSDLADRFCSFPGRAGTADDLAAGFLQAQDLRHSCLHILCGSVGHRLDEDGISSADHTAADTDHFCMVTKCHI